MKIYTELESVEKSSTPLAVAIGVFDGLHLGHMRVIEAAIKGAKKDGLGKGIITFSFSQATRPKEKEINSRISSQSIFLGTLKNLGVDSVIILPFEEIKDYSPKDFINNILKEKLNVSFLSCGKDFRFGKNASGGWQELEKYGKLAGINVKALPLVTYGGKPISSSLIRSKIMAGNMPLVNQLLGHRYAIDFKVVAGNRIGRTLGTPTINQPYPLEFVKPRLGVYASITQVDGQWYTSVTSVGTKPTIGVYDILAETYIQEFGGDLYGKKIRVEFLEFLREEEKFSSITLLRDQILQDSQKARELGRLYLKIL